MHSPKLSALYPPYHEMSAVEELHDNLISFVSVHSEVVRCPPGCQLLHLIYVCSLILSADQANDCGIISKGQYMVGVRRVMHR